MVLQATRTHDSSLPRHCSTDTVLFETADVTIGQFRCGVRHPEFRDTGPIRRAVVVFPRTSVWIRHAGEREFVADPNVVTIYNRGQRYQRFPISPDGDLCDWFALSDELALDVALSIAPSSRMTAERPFAFARSQSSTKLYARQRSLQTRAASGVLCALEAEEEVIGIVAESLAAAQVSSSEASLCRRRDLAEGARAELARTALENLPVTEIARRLGTSPFHLCRVFRAHTGQTMHGYRVRLRLRHAISRMDGSSSLSTIALDCGFASHAHLVRICRRELGMVPTVVRSLLGARV